MSTPVYPCLAGISQIITSFSVARRVVESAGFGWLCVSGCKRLGGLAADLVVSGGCGGLVLRDHGRRRSSGPMVVYGCRCGLVADLWPAGAGSVSRRLRRPVGALKIKERVRIRNTREPDPPCHP